MIFISAGHHNADSGAVGVNGVTESSKTIEFRELVIAELNKLGAKYIKDNDNETLAQYLNRIKTGSGSVVCEFHFDAYNGNASGCTSLVGNDADRLDKAMAKELVDNCATILSINNRGVKSESESNRGRLGLMREQGIVVLLELCFIDNPSDMAKYNNKKNELAKKIAEILIRYENLV